MKTNPFITGFVLLLSCAFLNSYSNSPVHQFTSSPDHQTASYYDRQWKKVDSLSNLGLPKSALAVVNKIYDQAKKEKNDPQYIKSVIYKLKLKADFREEAIVSSIKELKAEIKGSREPARQVLNSILAGIYQSYYQNNRYRFDDRTQVLNNTSDSIQTWDLKTLTRITIRTWLLSMQNPQLLKSVPIGNFKDILTKPDTLENSDVKMAGRTKTGYRPTLYDLLCWRALDYFSGNLILDKVSAEPFLLDQASYFLQAKEFAAMKLNLHSDTSSLLALAFSIYHDLAAFHANDKGRALIDEEIHRFGFLKSNSIITGKDSLYLDALKNLEQLHIASPYSTDVTYAIASALREQGSKYTPGGSEKYKWQLKEALGYCNKATERFPQSTGANNCRLLAAEIQKPSLQIQTEYAVVPSKPSLGVIEFRNLKTIYFRLAKTDPETNQEKTINRSREELVSYYSGLASQQNWSLELPNDGDFQLHHMEMKIPELPVGFYILIASSDAAFKDSDQVIAWMPFFSTHISYISQHSAKSEVSFFILDRETGQPMKNVVAEAFHNIYNYNTRKYENKKFGEYVTDENGAIVMPPVPQNLAFNRLYLRLKVNDDLFVTGDYYQYPLNPPDERTTLKTFFFTDRAIYRPGQTVYFKGVLLEKKGGDFSIKPGTVTTTVFTDVNNQKIAEQTFTTNDYGSFNGSFIIPQGLLPGTMTLSNSSGSVTISVEEYKRPTFEVIFDPVEGNYRLNDSVTVTGKAIAYAGNNLDGAAVKFRVVRAARYPFWEPMWQRDWWIPLPVSPETEILQGALKTNADGSFKVKFKAFPDQTIDKSFKPVFDYVIYADVTDINGETQSANESVSVGYISLLIGMDVPEKLDPARDTLFHLTSTNLNGRKTPAAITVSIQQLQQPDRFFVLRPWAKPDLNGMTENEFHSAFPNNVFADENNPAKWPVQQEILKKDLNTATDSLFRFSQIAVKSKDGGWRMEDGRVLPQGTYRLTLTAKDPYGETVEQKSTFVIYDPSITAVPVPEIDWFVPLKTTGEPGEKAKFLVGSRAENVKVLYEITVHDTLYSRKWLLLNNNQELVEIPIVEKFRGNFAVNFIFIRYNRSFQHTVLVNVPYTNKKLDIRFESFRNKLIPGQQEEWKIRISDAAKKGVKAEYLTAMYDASLDVFAANNWSFSVLRDYYSTLPWEISGGFRTSSGIYYPLHYVTGEYYSPWYEELDGFGFGLLSGGRFHYRGSRTGLDKATNLVAPMIAAESLPAMDESQTVGGATAKEEETTTTGTTKAAPKVEKQPQVQVRRDFRETAFFYPSIVTDSAGNLDLKFTLPESLTKWKILGFAYTKQLEYGMTEKELVTHKDLMVFPNSPRFVRQGDTLIFSAKVVNLSDRALNGDVGLELLDALTQKPVNLVISGNTVQSFTLPAAQSQAFQWRLAIPNDPALSVLQYRITARSGYFSDGEEKAFPVLTNRMLVTEALPLPVRGKGSFDFRFDKLVTSTSGKTLKNYKLTLEFASNPAWYAVQALTTLDDPKYPNADNIFRSYYANSIASFIANSNPKIKAVFESWKNLTPDALLSNLEKNQQLKSALLQETPWVLEAKDESQRKQRLALLFDLNTLSGRLDQSLKKLQRMQVSSGGWPWFDGMPENRYITQEIVTGLGHMDHLGIKNIRDDEGTWNMLVKAVTYLDGEIVKDYNDIKKYAAGKMDGNHLGTAQIQYLYARSYYLSDIPLKNSGEMNTAFRYFQGQAEKYWLQNDLYCQGMIGLALNRLGNKTVPSAILKSLSEKALHSQEMGMYWANEAGYNWYQAPIETQALLIEAYEEITADPKPVDEMKIWLLKQKQTQDWKTGRATAEACYALLLRGTDLLAEDPGVKINLGNETIDPQKLIDTKVEAGTGYFQVNRDGKEIRPEMGNVKVSKSNEGVAWGALYWQYFEDLDKITPHATPLKIEKKLFIERITPKGKILEPITNYKLQNTNYTSIKVGDKIIVRILLTVDRNLEFVHMKDMRASAFEPPVSAQMSGYRYQDGLGYYQSSIDLATNFFFDYLPKGTFVFEYPLLVNAAGDYSNGITTVQCMYAPEFGAHSEGLRVIINN